MSVEAQVSSRKTSFSAKNPACAACQAARALATSGRSCSAARDVFFSRQAQLQKKTPDSRAASLNTLLVQLMTQIINGLLRLGGDHGPNPIRMR
jgi:hypothetical protein